MRPADICASRAGALTAVLAMGIALAIVLAPIGCGSEAAEPTEAREAGGAGAGGGDGLAGTGVARPADHVDLSTRTPIFSEADVKRLFAGVRDGKRQRYDPLAIATLIPDLELAYPWPEHEGGRVVIRTNNLGFRRDGETSLEKSGLRVLVCGDSHTDGLVENDESFITLLEQRLNAAGAGEAAELPAIECLNAGVGGTGPHSYLGMLRSRLALRPDVCVVMLYAGNDFTDSVFIADQLAGRGHSGGWAYFAPLDAAFKRWNTSLVGNSFNQAYAFKHRPEDAPRGLAEAVAVFEDLVALCRREGIAVLVGVIPTKPEVDRDDEATVAAVLEALDLQRADMEINTRLREAFVGALRLRGIPCFDPTQALRDSGAPGFWKKDHHLNVEGNAVLAGELERALVPLLPPAH